eukprot:3614011-Pleurochrysis_carterae.AAC.1
MPDASAQAGRTNRTPSAGSPRSTAFFGEVREVLHFTLKYASPSASHLYRRAVFWEEVSRRGAPVR